ncbi:hypothetical protein BCR39DRAFT_524149 [Naematelia encephala]|uniref:RNI-like protein n=1 Tax=Naematelia encephala TaxID=71784 RepID=A0A1Y2BB95_9TREE|nr:hypothetical protein BCR39DRAFT_524149 [Naematelia encephala]
MSEGAADEPIVPQDPPSVPTSSPPVTADDTQPTSTSSLGDASSDSVLEGGPPSAALETPSSEVAVAGPSSPARRRPKPPTKGILKPPPPPAKPSLGNRLRDIVTVVGGGAKSLFEPIDAENSAGANAPLEPPSVSGALNALSGKIGLGFSRFVNAAATPTPSPTSSPLPARSISLPETGTPVLPEKNRQKQPLKRATFLLPTLSITYPISSQGEPWSQKVMEDRKRIETSHRDLLASSSGAEYWTAQRLVGLYENACRGHEERPRVGIVRALEIIPPPPKPRNVHLTLRTDPSSSSLPTSINVLDTPLNRHAAEALADVLVIDWGLLDLKLEGGILDGDDAVKCILHALLVSGSLPSLSLAGNKKIRAGGWRLLAFFLKRAKSLRYIDLSDTNWDKKGIDYLVQALTCSKVNPPPTTTGSASSLGTDTNNSPNPDHNTEPPPSPPKTDEEKGDEETVGNAYGSFIRPAPLLKETDEGIVPAAVQTLRMDGCNLKGAVLESLAQGIRSSDIRNISLRRNRIGPLGAVALALMIRDYPDSAHAMTSLSPSFNSNLTASQEVPPYTPYVARTRRPRSPQPPPDSTPADYPALPPIPLVVSSATGGITTRTVPNGYKPPPLPKHPLVMPGGGNSAIQDAASFGLNSATVEGRLSSADFGGASLALQKSVRSLDGVERIGRLLTLDLKGNEIRTGVGYIAQVLKRNRTLKVLNLADNGILPAGLAALAEALKYNSTLETLDLSSNPCSGPSLEGIAALRTTFTVNTSLKRLFLSDTGLTTEGAISLAEFLPETKSILHLDLTANPAVETAGILAISVGLKSNQLIRCLDISVPPNNPDLAEISQNILQSCIRNTELAAASLSKDHARQAAEAAIWGPIKKSTLVRQVKEADQVRAEKEHEDAAKSPEGVAREYVYRLKPERVLVVSEETARDLGKWYDAGRLANRKGATMTWEPGQLPKEDFGPLVERAKALRERLADSVQETTDAEALERMLSLNDLLTSQLEDAKTFQPPPRLLLPSQIVPTEPPPQPSPAAAQASINPRFARRHMRVSSLELSSPNFSIGDSDADSDAEEVDVGSLPQQPNAGLGVESVPEEVVSPVERASRAWVEEEGEIFRKGMRLGVVGDEEEEGASEEVSGEVLKKEILETPVERSPTRRILTAEDAEQEAEAEIRIDNDA